MKGGTPIDWFTAKYEPEPNSGCWLWLASYTENGYGMRGEMKATQRQTAPRPSRGQIAKKPTGSIETMIAALPTWSIQRRAARRQTLVTGQGFFAYAQTPSAWRVLARTCAFCRRGERDGLTGLWEFGQGFVCTPCAEDIVEYRMPVAWT